MPLYYYAKVEYLEKFGLKNKNKKLNSFMIIKIRPSSNWQFINYI